jgi:hypothetical protein
VIITSNHKTDGLYLPADDRRHFVAWSSYQMKDFDDDYWKDLWKFYAEGGNEHVTAYLSELDLSDFDPKAPPPKTPAFRQIITANAAPEDLDLIDALERINKDAITIGDLIEKADCELAEWLCDRKSRRAIPHRLSRCGYVSVHNPDRPQDGLWKIGDRRQTIYARAELDPQQQLKTAKNRAKLGT